MTPATDPFQAIKEAEFNVRSCISVREQYITKLRSLVDALLPFPALPPKRHADQNHDSGFELRSKSTTNASKKKQARDVIADRLRVRAAMPDGKELQILGDWLLLLRVASVNVVEGVVKWRSVVHQGRPVPFEFDNKNYILEMASDVDFLNSSSDLVEWLGFGLLRNPFIVRGGLDDDMCNPAAHPKAKWSMLSPPLQLVRPLASITLEDGVLDGSRISMATTVLKDEEAMLGKVKLTQLVQKYVKTSFDRLLDDQSEGDTIPQPHTLKWVSVIDEISVLTKALCQRERRIQTLQKEIVRLESVKKQLETQVSLTTHHRDNDFKSDHRAWEYREHCRAMTLRSLTWALEQIQSSINRIRDAKVKNEVVTCNLKGNLAQLVKKKDLERREGKTYHGVMKIRRRTDTTRRKTVERNRDIQAKRMSSTRSIKILDTEEISQTPLQPTGENVVDGLASAFGTPPCHLDKAGELERKRSEKLKLRHDLRLDQEQYNSLKSKDLNRRRNENSQMFLEDRRSQLVESRLRSVLRERARTELGTKQVTTPMFSIVQRLGGINGLTDTKYRVSAYIHRAKGYVPAGIQFVAYDPSTSRTYDLLMSNREYSSLGYGRTQQGLTSFCQWLCLVYERRQRQFKLIWSGAPCPPPLRVRDYDHSLVCVHKEGVRAQTSFLISYQLVAAYIRTSDCSKLRVVISTLNSDERPVEFVVPTSQLFPVNSMALRRDDTGGKRFISWLHTLDGASEWNGEERSSQVSRNRVYSGEITGVDGDKVTLRVDVFDSSLTEYEIVLWSQHSTTETQQTIPLLKRDVNPYAVRLPSSAYGDLLDCIRLERKPKGTRDQSTLQATILPTWKARLSRYIRAIRLTRFGFKIHNVFYFVVVTLVQQKTEFRAHLVFEMSSVEEVCTRQSIRISLSHFLRCSDSAFQAMRTELALAPIVLTCEVCAQNRQRVTVASTERAPPANSQFSEARPCIHCDVAQRSRMEVIRRLVGTREVSECDVNTLHFATCNVCGAMPPPIGVVIPSCVSYVVGCKDLVERFAVFDVDDGQKDTVEHILESLFYQRIVILHTTSRSSATRSNLGFLSDKIRALLNSGVGRIAPAQPVELVLISQRVEIIHTGFSADRATAIDHISTETRLSSAIHQATNAILKAAETEFASIAIDHDQVTSLENYLVCEALLIEATRVILHPELAWRIPGETIGVSSWSTACEFLQNPHQLISVLMNRPIEIIGANAQVRKILRAYSAHPKWPRSIDKVRAPFRPLLSCIIRVLEVQQIVDAEGGYIYDGDDHVSNNTVDELGAEIYTFGESITVICIVKPPQHNPDSWIEDSEKSLY